MHGLLRWEDQILISCHHQELAGLSALVDEKKTVDVFTTPTQLDGELVTLTLLPRARWQTLINLDVIQVTSSD